MTAILKCSKCNARIELSLTHASDTQAFQKAISGKYKPLCQLCKNPQKTNTTQEKQPPPLTFKQFKDVITHALQTSPHTPNS